jgi:hypothetical protein
LQASNEIFSKLKQYQYKMYLEICISDKQCFGSGSESRRGKISPEKEEKLSLKTRKNGKN